MQFLLGGAEIARFRNARFGIGNTNPLKVLDVTGDAQVTTDLTVGDDLFMLSDAAVIRFGADSEITLTHDHNVGLILNTEGTANSLAIVSGDDGTAGGPSLNLKRDSASPADNDGLGAVIWTGRNNNSQDFQAAIIKSQAADVTDGTEDSYLYFRTMHAGSETEHMAFLTTETVFNDPSNDLDFRVESNGNANMIFVDGGNNHVCIGTATDHGGVLNVDGPVLMSESDTLLLRITSSGSDVKFQSRVSDKDIRFEGIDGGSDITALHLDMSAAGLAIFSDGIVTSGGDSRINIGNNNNQAFQVGSSDDNKECMRIEHTDADNPQGLVIAYTGGAPDSSGGDKFIRCSDTGAERFHVDAQGDILADGVATNSDERLKENIADATTKWDDIKALKVRNFTWKAEHHPKRDHKHIGFIAQEFETVFPSLVKEHNIHPDPIYVEADKDADGNLPDGVSVGDAKNTKNRKNIHTTAMIPMLTKALQEAMAKIETLESKVQALEDA